MNKFTSEKTLTWKKWGAFAFSIVVAVFLLYIVLRQAGLKGMEAFIKKTSPWIVLGTAVVYTMEMFVRAFRWKEILRISGISVTLMDSFWAYSLGNGLNIFMPAKLGDLGRSYYLKTTYGNKYMETIPTTLMDRFYDIVGIYLVLLLDMVFLVSTIKMERWLTVLLIVGLVALIFGALVLEVFHRNQKLVALLPGKHLKNLAKSMLLSFAGALRNPLGFLKLSMLSFIVWAMECLTAFVVFYGTGMDIPPAILIFGLMVATLTKAIPITPGGMGVFEGAMVVCFAMFGLKSGNIGVGATVFHLILNVIGALTAAYILIKKEIKALDITRGEMD